MALCSMLTAQLWSVPADQDSQDRPQGVLSIRVHGDAGDGSQTLRTQM
jgi:hypothetical protein